MATAKIKPPRRARSVVAIKTDDFLNAKPMNFGGNRIVPNKDVPKLLLGKSADLVITDGIKRTDEILAEMAKTFKERNAVYGDNYRMVAKLMAVLFPHGLPPDLFTKDQFHLFELIIVKLSRFAISNLTHRDSVHDMAVYAAMIESVISEQEANK